MNRLLLLVTIVASCFARPVPQGSEPFADSKLQRVFPAGKSEVLDSSWIESIYADFNAVSESDFTDSEIERSPDEEVIGRLTSSLKKIQTLANSTEKERNAYFDILQKRDSLGQESTKKVVECMRAVGKLDILAILFEYSARDTFQCWDPSIKIGARKGFILVKTGH